MQKVKRITGSYLSFWVFQEWYDQKDEVYDPQNPTDGIAKACCLDEQLPAAHLYDKIKSYGFIVEQNGVPIFKLPESEYMAELDKGLKKWEDKISTHLGALTIKYYQCFAEIIIEVNAAILKITAGKMGHQSEEEFFSRYPMFRPYQDGNTVGGMIEKLNVRDVESQEEDGAVAGVEGMDISGEDDFCMVFPLKLLPEEAYALLHLAKTAPSPQTKHDVIEHISSICNIIYVVSPKYALSSAAGTQKTASLDKSDFKMQLHLGRKVTKIQKEVSEITQVALMLQFPSQSRIINKYKKQAERMKRWAETRPALLQQKVTVGMEDIKSILKEFQRYIYRNGIYRAQRHRATVVVNNKEAEERCREKLYSWLDAINDDPKSAVTEEEFSKRIIDFSYEIAHAKSDAVIRKLESLGYLQLNGEKVKYDYMHDDSVSQISDNSEVGKFIGRWNTDQKPYDGTKPKEGYLSVNSGICRKRPITMPSGNGKKARVLDL